MNRFKILYSFYSVIAGFLLVFLLTLPEPNLRKITLSAFWVIIILILSLIVWVFKLDW